GIDRKRHQFFMEDIKRTFAGEHLNFEVKFDHQVFSVNTTPLAERDGEVKRVLFVYNNITHQKQIEKKIRKSLRKEHQLNNLKSQFISTASHEFRTPLSAILSSADLIESLNRPENEANRIKHLDRIKSNVQHLTDILDEFLSIGRLEAGKVAVRSEHFDLVPFSKYLIRELRPILKSGQKIISKFESKGIPVHMDPKLLDHILRNLLVNAIKFSDRGSRVIFKSSTDGNMVFFEISDSGIGISPMDQKQIFQQFFRAGNAANIQGTGLGLHLVKQYVTLMKGSISLKSEVDRGTTFYLQFDLNTP
ncbi:MAG TPA: HAMP domain-containing sensor histidine kinase, partial [Arenibacter sp.]|nr:HAMP domain-containing sensor histidine kinase [Arenibacter sp.]